MNTINFSVCIRCFTYNHSKFIVNALNGFVKQHTTFPFIILLVDDASSDGEQEVIRSFINEHFDKDFIGYVRETEYANISFAQHKTNRNCFIAAYLLKYNHYQIKKPKLHYLTEWRERSQYEAICEGDDYWTDPMKLQVQVDFLEKHSDYSFCCHRFDIYEHNQDRWLKEYAYNYYEENRDLEITMDLYSKVWITQPLTMVARMGALKQIEPFLKKYKYRRDMHLFYHLLKVGKGISINRNMGVYRWHDGGIASSLRGINRYMLAYEIEHELLITTHDLIFQKPFVRNAIRLLRNMTPSSESCKVLKEAWKYSEGYKEKFDLIIAFLIPQTLYVNLSKLYRKHYLKSQVI